MQEFVDCLFASQLWAQAAQQTVSVLYLLACAFQYRSNHYSLLKSQSACALLA
jgi:hypothetical protein